MTKRDVRASARCTCSPDKRKITGWPVKYEDWSEPLGPMGFRERFLPGAFRDCLQTKPDVIACMEHDFGRILGRTSAGTLRVQEGATGVYVELDPPNTTSGRDLVESVRRGDIRGMSFAFDIERPGEDDRWYRDSDGGLRRDVKRATIYEVSFVAAPAYQTTEAALRSLASHEQGRLDLMRRRLAILEKS